MSTDTNPHVGETDVPQAAMRTLREEASMASANRQEAGRDERGLTGLLSRLTRTFRSWSPTVAEVSFPARLESSKRPFAVVVAVRAPVTASERAVRATWQAIDVLPGVFCAGNAGPGVRLLGVGLGEVESVIERILQRDRDGIPGVDLSLGTAVLGEDHASGEVLASLAVEAARRAVAGTVTAARPGTLERALSRHQVAADLTTALADDAVVLFWQPIHRLAGGPVGVEALVRWRHPDKGLLKPGRFVPHADGMGAGLELGRRVLTRAVQTGRELQAARGEAFFVSVNASVTHLCDGSLRALVAEVLEDFPAGSLRLELPAFRLAGLRRDPAIDEAIHLQEMGVAVVAEGVGPSDELLDNVLQLPVSAVKLDLGAFLAAGQGPGTRALLWTLDELDKAGIAAMIGRVESEASLAMLEELVKREVLVQGHALGVPVPAEVLQAGWGMPVD